MGAQLAHTENDHVLGLTGAAPDRCTELFTAARVQPLIGLVDAAVGQVREVTAGFDQIRLAGQVTPDDAHLLAI